MSNFVTWPYVLRRGHSDDPSHGACAMAAINWLMYGIHGDAPPCASPVIAANVIRGNDAMPDDIRQRFLPYLHRIAGSRSEQHENARCRVLWLAAIRIFAPRALDAAGLHTHATRLRDLPDSVTAEAAASAAAAVRAAAAAEAAAEAAGVAEAVRTAAASAAGAAVWDDYFAVLDAALSAGPQGEEWSATIVAHGTEQYRAAGGLARLEDA